MSSLLLERGTVVGGDFVVVRPLGHGGMGAVYLVEQRSTGKLRALKVMNRELAPDPALQKRFEQEAKVGARIRSGHIVEVLAAGIDSATPFLVMELLEGVDLARHLGQRGRLPLAEVRSLFEQLCHGIAAAHAVGVVHRDLKPENIFLARTNRADGRDTVVKILDFGIAKLAAEAGTRATAAVGTPLWMAPEQTAPGPVTPAADVWALGLIAYSALTGEHFWRSASLASATPMQLLREIVLDPIPPARERGGDRLPPEFDAWFRRCVARAAGDRFQDAGDLWTAMQSFLPAPASGQPPSLLGTDPFAATASASEYESAAAALRKSDDETPLGVVASGPAAPPPEPRSARRLGQSALLVAGGIGLGVLCAAFIAKHPAATSTSSTPTVPSIVVVPVPSEPVAAAAPIPPPPPHAASPPVAPSDRRPALPDGFSDPHDRARQGDVDGPVVSSVSGRHTRLFTRLVSNASNVKDIVVRSAIDWSSWRYGQCYPRVFSMAKEMTAGTVTVSFDIVTQLPQHVRLESSTFASHAMGECLVAAVSGQMLNAAGPEGAGHVVYAFRFVLTD